MTHHRSDTELWDTAHVTQPGYDSLAGIYAETFPSAYLTPLEHHVVAAFADQVRDDGRDGIVVDVGCGLGHVTADLAHRGLDVIGVDPSAGMLEIARRHHRDLVFHQDDARLARTDLRGRPLRAVLSRFSLIHVDPAEVPGVLAGWASRMEADTLVAVACQSTDSPGDVVEFDHAVAPAWRWHPDRLSAALSEAGFDEEWRAVSRPDSNQRFPAAHLVARRRPQ